MEAFLATLTALIASETAPVVAAFSGWLTTEILSLRKGRYKSLSHAVLVMLHNVSEKVLNEEDVQVMPVPVPVPVPKPQVVTSKVPYFSQNDNQDGQGYRECASSSVAMLLASKYPDKCSTDDAYVEELKQYGDTTSMSAHMHCLHEHYKVRATFTNTNDLENLQEAIKNGPVAVGLCHHGPLNKPDVKSGHWVVVKSLTKSVIVVNDPNGRYDWVNGVHDTGHSGENLNWPLSAFLSRWLVPPGKTGWMIQIS